MSNRWKLAQNCWIFGAKAYPNPSLKGRAFLSLPQPLPKGKGFSNFNMRFRAGFCVGFWTPQCRFLDAVVLGSVLGFVYSLYNFFCFPFYLCIVVVCARTQHVWQERANRRKLHSPHRADATFCFGSLAFCLRPGFRLLNLMLLYFVSRCVLLSVSSVTQFAMLHS